MDQDTYEQYELSSEQVDENWKYLIEGMKCSMVIYNDIPITITPPNHVNLTVQYCEPGAKGDTATNVTKPVKVETGAEFNCPAFIEIGNIVRIDTRSGEYVERVRSK
jgi:elongation factor P